MIVLFLLADQRIFRLDNFQSKNMIKKILRTRFAFVCLKKINKVKYFRIFFRENSKIKRVFLKQIQFYSIDNNNRYSNVLTQEVDHHKFTIKLGMVIKAYSKKNKINVYSYSPYFNRRLGWIDKYEKGYFSIFQSFTSRIYRKMGYQKLFSLDDSFKDKKVISDLFYLKYSKLKTTEDLLNLEIEGIQIGDLIYDTYLRFYEKHTINNLNDDNLKKLIHFSIDNFFLVKHYIEKFSITALFTTYTTYTTHGLAVRICLDKGIPVYSVGDDSYMVKRVIKEYPYSVNNYWEFKKNKLNKDLEVRIIKDLNFRFQGGIDNAISYMRSSSFKYSNEKMYFFENRLKRNVVIYVHDLFDSPHWLKKMQFNDYFEYIIGICDCIKNDNSTRYYVKLHPNAIKNSNEIISEYINKLNTESISILPLSISNLEIINFRPDLIVTVNGTVGMEMAYFEIPVVALEDNIYMNFSFVHTCSSLNEFYSIVKGEKPPVVNFNRDEIISFYYQAYIHDLLPFDKKILPFISSNGYVSLDEFLNECNSNEQLLYSEDLIGVINEIFNLN